MRDEQCVVDCEILDTAVLVVPVRCRWLLDQPCLLEFPESIIGDGVDHLGAAFPVCRSWRESVEMSSMKEFLEAAQDVLVAAADEGLQVRRGCKAIRLDGLENFQIPRGQHKTALPLGTPVAREAFGFCDDGSFLATH